MTLSIEQLAAVFSVIGALLFFERRLAKVEARMEILIRRCIGAGGNTCESEGSGD